MRSISSDLVISFFPRPDAGNCGRLGGPYENGAHPAPRLQACQATGWPSRV